MLSPTYLTVLQGPRQPLELVCACLKNWGCRLTLCATGEEVFTALTTKRTDLVLIDMTAADSAPLMAEIKADPDVRHLPVIAATMGDPALVGPHALALGADDIFALPAEETELYARVRAMSRLAALEVELRRREHVQAAFGVMASKPAPPVPAIGPAGGDQVQVMSALGGAATAAYAETAEAALERLRRGDLDVAVITAARETEETEQLCTAIRSDPRLFDLPVLMVCRPDSFDDRTTPFEWGVSDVLFQPFHPEILRLRVNGWVRQQRLRRRLRGDVGEGEIPRTTDRLTRLYGHGFLHGYADLLLQQGGDSSVAVVGFGVVKMTWINEAHGYAAGDRLLAQIGALLARAGRAEDLPAHFGGDRFCIVINGVSVADARAIAERIAATIVQAPLDLGDGQAIGIELRTGVSMASAGDHAGSLIGRAFERMQIFGVRQAS
jgi:two-component system cell cycle response regulator